MKKRVQIILGVMILSLIMMTPTYANGNKGKGGQKKDKVHGGPPAWAPAHGYRAKQRHIYYPEHNIYYDTQREVYIYVDMGRWEVSARLPLPLRNSRNIDLGAQVALDVSSDSPQFYNDEHRSRYQSGNSINRSERGSY